jgi:hypothetical protein
VSLPSARFEDAGALPAEQLVIAGGAVEEQCLKRHNC